MRIDSILQVKWRRCSCGLREHSAMSLSLYTFLIVMLSSSIAATLFSSIYVGLFLLLTGFLLIFAARKLLGGGTLVGVSLAAFILGIAIASIMYFGYMADYGEPYWVPGADDQVFEQVAARMYRGGFVSVFDMQSSSDSYIRQHNSKGWVMGLAYLMYLGDFFGGYHSMVPRIFNIFILNVLAMVVVNCFAKRYATSEKWLCVMYLSLALMPNALAISSHVYRDTVSAFLVVVCYFLALEICDKKSIARNIILIGLLTYVSYWLRSMNLFFIAGMVVSAASQIIVKRLKANVATVGTIAVVVCVLSVLFVGYGDQMLAYVTRYGDRITSGDSRIVSMVYGVPLFPLGLPLRILAYLCSPFYYRVLFDPDSWFASTEDAIHLCVTLGTIVLVSLYIYAFLGAKEDARTGIALLVVLVGICISTSGYRHIMMAYPLLILLIAEGMRFLADAPQKRMTYRTIALLTASSLCFAFGVIALV